MPRAGTDPARIVVFGNSGSGKSTWAIAQSALLGCAHLDLDTVAWEPALSPPTRRSLQESQSRIDTFVSANEQWVIEGCYADLLTHAARSATEVIFLNPGVDICIANARQRPWEPHKYSSPAAQERNLEMLLEWIRQYEVRTDEFSLLAHRELFSRFAGAKHEFRSNARDGRSESLPETGGVESA
ncbi:MAG: AAA family ATPase [Gemmatimonadota bacterium]